MSHFNSNKQHQQKKSSVHKPFHHELDKAPRQFNDYMNSVCGRFTEICQLYLDGLSMDDVKYLKPEDLIALVPDNQYKHKLLMTIMVRRYLYRFDDCVDKSEKCDTLENVQCDDDTCSFVSDRSSRSCDKNFDLQKPFDLPKPSDLPKHYDSIKQNEIKQADSVYSCDKCTHSCHNSNCSHSCDDYTKISQRVSRS